MPTPDVALISPYPDPGARHGGHSGVASYTANLAHALSDDGLQVAVIAARDGHTGRHADGDVQVVRAYDRGPGALPRAAAAAAATGAPVVHLQHELFLFGGPTAGPGLVPALAGLRACGRRTVTTLHQVVGGADVDRDFTALHRVRLSPAVARGGLGAVQRTAARLSDRCVVHEAPFAEHVPGAGVVPHGVEEAQTMGRREARRAVGEDHDRLLVLCFGFLAPYKGLETAIDAAALVPADVRLVVAGGDHPRLQAAGHRYADELRRRPGADLVRFTGRVADADVATWFAAADVALLAYPRPFSSSGALALAYAHGTPALLSEALGRCVGAPAELRVAAEPSAVAARLRELAADPVRLDRLSAATAGLAAARRWPSVAARHRRIYEEVCHADRDPQH